MQVAAEVVTGLENDMPRRAASAVDHSPLTGDELADLAVPQEVAPDHLVHARFSARHGDRVPVFVGVGDRPKIVTRPARTAPVRPPGAVAHCVAVHVETLTVQRRGAPYPAGLVEVAMLRRRLPQHVGRHQRVPLQLELETEARVRQPVSTQRFKHLMPQRVGQHEVAEVDWPRGRPGVRGI
ncbi:hypothetical protein A5662_18105 [Mycobacteriaceae bacterium 1482268.1]|nr:hypothetical protein A5662_18105 [Mycobacteriaceae bacterium 1482268.1]